MILAFQSCYVGSTKCTAAVVTKQPETSEIVGFAEGILDAAIWRVDGKELGGDNLTTVLKFEYSQLVVRISTLVSSPMECTYITLETLQMKGTTESSNELAGQRLVALLT
jgi:hypothetical protein